MRGIQHTVHYNDKYIFLFLHHQWPFLEDTCGISDVVYKVRLSTWYLRLTAPLRIRMTCFLHYVMQTDDLI